MDIDQFGDYIASGLNGQLNGCTLKIYKGTAPVDGNAYGDGTAHADDLLASTTIQTYVMETYKVVLGDNQVVNATGTGTAAWFAMVNVNGATLISTLSDINGTGVLILNKTALVATEDFSVLDFELQISGA